jgi:hypothetical protein
MDASLVGLERFLGIGLGAICLVVLAAAAYGVILLKRFGAEVVVPNKKARPLPKHKVEAATIDERWTDEIGYERMLERIYKEVQAAINEQDRETLEIVTQGPALAFFQARLQALDLGSDKREVVQGSIRESWDPATQKLVVTLALTRWAKGWRRFYEEWTLQRQGNAWFVVGAKATKV